MKDLLKKYKKRLIAGGAVIILGVAAYLSGSPVDWAKILADASKGEVTDTAQQIEDLNKDPVE